MYINYIFEMYPETSIWWKIKVITKHYFSPHNIRLNILQVLIGKDLTVIANCSKITGKATKGLVHINSGRKAFILNNVLIGDCEEAPDYLIEA